jgi:transcriptional regulator with XRE-family HTH domain
MRTGSPLAELRHAAGYKTARSFAQAIDVPAATYSRWERASGNSKSAIPLAAAWKMADALECTIDDVVGRNHATTGEDAGIVATYRALSASGRSRADEYLQFLLFRDRVIKSSESDTNDRERHAR